MATANFRSMEYGMPLVCGKSYSQLADEWRTEYEAEPTDSDLYFMAEDEVTYAKEIAEEFTENLTFYDVTIEYGYYESYQFYVVEKFNRYFDLDKESKYCIDNDEAHEYFDMCRSEALRKADAEKRKIRKWLLSLAENGFNHIVCVERFSNGEAIYEMAAPRTEMIAAVKGL